jgi:membrane protein implicated in regulation of membrane protease activity
MEPYQVTIIVAIGIALFELMIPSAFIFLGFSLASLLVALVQYLNHDFVFNRDLLTFTIGSCLIIFVIRKSVKRKTDQIKLKTDDVNQY